MLPTSFGSPAAGGAAAAHADALTGWPPIAQLITSRLWTCCSTMWSPQSHSEVVPVAELVLDVGHVRLAGVEPDAAAWFQ